MNCDTVETEYFYHQLGSQGETETRDSSSCLYPADSPHPPPLFLVPLTDPISRQEPDAGPKEKVSSTTEPSATSHIQHPNLSSPSSAPEVNPSNVSLVNEPNNVRQEDDGIRSGGETSGRDEGEGVDPDTGLYKLPYRCTRGVPPKRYSPEWQGRKPKYPAAYTVIGQLTEMARAFEAALYEDEEIPRSVEEAMRHNHWRAAMEKEMEALIKNKTWEKHILPKGKKPVGCRWVFTIKRRADGSIERYKARLVAKGYTQTYGIDYDETFSPVAKMSTMRVLLSVAACKDWPLHQFDVTNAFLHGELKKNEEVYMEAPPGYSGEFKNGEVCKLKKTLYGLKQSPRVWFGRFCQAMTSVGFKQSNSDHTLFLKKRGDKITCLIIYVDDMIITPDDKEEIENLKRSLFQEFEMKDLGAMKYFLGIKILRSKYGIFLRQRKYVLDLLAETGLLECKPAETPIILNHGLKIEEGGKLTDRGKYQRLVGKLIYLAHTRPDIAYAVGVVSQFMHQPQESHMEATLRIVRYLKGTTGYGTFLEKKEH